MMGRIMRLSLLLFSSLIFFQAYGQYPATGNKQRLGYQTTGDGLVFRGNGSPVYTPSGINSAWAYIDTTAGTIYTYYAGSWHLVSAGGGTSFDGHVDSLVFNSAVTVVDSVGKMYYDAANETISVGIDGGAVYQLGQELYYPLVINKSGATIHNGQPVMVDTATLVTGDHVRIIPARNGATYPSEYVMGVATADIPNDSTGLVTWFGYVREVKEADIAQTSVTLNAGDILYISATEPGKYTNVRPSSPAHQSTIALVVRKPSVNNITLLVRPWLAPKLDNLSNVNVTSVTGLSVLRYNSTTGVWDASATPGIVAADTSAMLSYYLRKADTTAMLVPYQKDITLTTTGTSGAATFNGVTLNVPQYQAALTNPVTGTGAAGQVAYWSGTGTQAGSNNLFWDNTNAHLGVGTNTPGGKITAHSNANTGGVVQNWNINTGTDTYAAFANYAGNSSTGDANFRLSALIAFPKNYTNATYGGAYAAGGSTLWMYGASDTTNNNMVFAITQTVPNLSEANYNPSFRWVKAITNNYTIANELMRLNKTGLGIKQNTPLYTLDINATDGIRIPVGTTVQRPTGAAGVLRFNSDSTGLEYHNGTSWRGIVNTWDASTGGGGGSSVWTQSGSKVYVTGALVGINTTNPTKMLEVDTSSNPVVPGGWGGNPDPKLVVNGIAGKSPQIAINTYGNTSAGFQFYANGVPTADFGYGQSGEIGFANRADGKAVNFYTIGPRRQLSINPTYSSFRSPLYVGDSVKTGNVLNVPTSVLQVAGSFALNIPITVNTSTYTVTYRDNWFICTYAGTTTFTLPNPSTCPGRILYFLNRANQTRLGSVAEIIPITGGSATQTIVANTSGKWVTLVSDGSNWQTLQGN